MRVQCNGPTNLPKGAEETPCSYTWDFQAKKPSNLLKRSYWVRCPKCKAHVYRRVKRKLLVPKDD